MKYDYRISNEQNNSVLQKFKALRSERLPAESDAEDHYSLTEVWQPASAHDVHRLGREDSGDAGCTPAESLSMVTSVNTTGMARSGVSRSHLLHRATVSEWISRLHSDNKLFCYEGQTCALRG